MADLNVQEISNEGLTPVFTAVNAEDKFSIGSDQRIFLYIKNDDTAAKTVTIPKQRSSVVVDGYGRLDIEDIVISIPAGEERMIGAYPNLAYSSLPSSDVTVQYSDTTSVTAGAFFLPRLG